jgi:acyl homoserine lactone synthase
VNGLPPSLSLSPPANLRLSANIGFLHCHACLIEEVAMRVIAIENPITAQERRMLEEMHRMRARIFAGRLGWKVTCLDGMEFDEFDLLSPTYILALAENGNLAGSVRLLPADGPTMLERVFPQLLREGSVRSHAAMVESSRFCVDTQGDRSPRSGVHDATRALFAGIIEWGLLNGYSELVTATDLRLERLLKRCGWAMERLGSPFLINETPSIAGKLPLTEGDFARQRLVDYRSSFMGKQCEIHHQWASQLDAEGQTPSGSLQSKELKSCRNNQRLP